MLEDQRRCLECEHAIIGRSDKKFCSDICRSAYNNRQKDRDEFLIKDINRTLRKNWKILRTIGQDANKKVSFEVLSRQGFDFELFTSIYQTKEGKTYCYCYDYGYLRLSETDFLIVKKLTSNK